MHRDSGILSVEGAGERARGDQLRRSEEPFRLLVEAVTDCAIYLLDPTGHITTWNSGAQNIKGYTASEIVGKHYSAFFTPEDVERGKPLDELRIARSAGRYEEEGWRVRKDGSRFWCNVVLTPIYESDGTLAGFAKVTRDLTERRAAEEAERTLIREQAARSAAEAAEEQLRQEHERYRALSEQLQVILEGVPDGITVQDRSGKLLFANSAGARLCGFASVRELLEASPGAIVAAFEIFDEDGKPFDPQRLPGRRVLMGADSAEALIRVREVESRRSWWAFVRASGVGGAPGRPDIAVNVWHDVTSERLREEHQRFLSDATGALAASLDYHAMLKELALSLVPGFADWCSIHLLEDGHLETVAAMHADPKKRESAATFFARHPPDPSVPGGVWEVIRTGRAVLYSDISDELLERSVRDVEYLAAVREVGMRSVLMVPVRTRDRVWGAITLVAAESDRRYESADVALAEEIGRRAGVAIENAELYATAQRAASDAEEAVGRAELAAQRAEQASRSKDEFLATVSHELRTPLNAIVGWAALLQKRSTEPFVSKGIEVIDRNAKAQGKLIEDILDVSRVITGKLKLELRAVDLVAIASGAIEVVRPSIDAKGLILDFDPPSTYPRVVADPERLQQVLWNLLSNAVKFSTTGGRVTVKIEQHGSLCVVSVTDEGVGIEASFLPHVFERFRQADSTTARRFGGLGLGLGIVRHIVELHGGAVQASSEGTGKGSTFTMSLPIRAVTPSHPKPAQSITIPPNAVARHARVSLHGLRVLVVDDEADARDLLEAVCVGAGAVVAAASSAEEGFRVLEEFAPNVVVSDIGMPGEDGYGFMRRIRAWREDRGAAVACIALTAYARSEDESLALAAGYTAHVGKPVDPDDLLAIVGTVAQRSSAPLPG